MVGRKQERELTVFGRYMRLASTQKATVLGIPRYTWRRLSEESGTHSTILLKAVSGENIPARETVWRWIKVLLPDPEVEQLICHSPGYATESEQQEAEARIDALEHAAGIQ